MRFALLLSVLFACALVAASSALAGDEASLGSLTPEERAVLERRIPGLGQLPVEQQQQIVRNVERLRGLDPAQRALVERRLRAARDAGLQPRDLAERQEAWRGLGDKRVLAEWQMRMLKALGWRAWNDLPARLRADPAVAGLLQREWPHAFHQRFLRKAALALSDEEVRSWEPSVSLPEPWKREFAKDRARLLAAGEPQKAMSELRKRVLLGRALGAVQETLSAPTGGGENHAARLALLGERLRALAEPAFQETLAEFVKLAEVKGPEGFAAQVREMVAPPKPPPEMLRKIEALQLVTALEAFGPTLARRPALIAPADALLRAALVDDLGMPAATFAALPSRERGMEERSKALRAWMDEAFPREARRQLFQRKWGGERAPWGQGGPGGPWRRGLGDEKPR